MDGLISLVFCVVVIQTTHACTYWSDYDRKHCMDGPFLRLSGELFSLDIRTSFVCDYKQNRTTETYFANSYRLSVPLPAFDEGDISVKLRHRVLFIQAYKARKSKLFSNLKILPVFLKFDDANWTFANGVLGVNIPYKFTSEKGIVSSCEDMKLRREEPMITVPQAGVDVRFGDDTTSVPMTPQSNVVTK